MIIRRQLYPQNKLPIKKTHDSGMELKPIYKKVAPPNANTIIRDVEDLLKPIEQQKQCDETTPGLAAKERTERNLWRNDEVMEMLYTMQELKALEKLNDKTVKSENVFKDVQVIMNRNGFVKKSHVQIWTKWKFLKSTYMTSRRNGVIPRMVPQQVYDTIHQMVTGLNQSMADSCSSVDGDNSSVSGMVISGVEGGVAEVGVANEEDDDSFGMAHPIFGFRLGMVKSEPEDTGYEAVENNDSEKDPLEEQSSITKSNEHVKEEECNPPAKTNEVPKLLQRPLDMPHRGRGRPPKNAPITTSTPNNTPSPATKPPQMPPLRVAPFAKVLHSTNAIAANRLPPPLTIPPTPRIRVTNLAALKNSELSKFTQPKLIPKPNHQQQPPPAQQVRIQKELSVQSRASSTPSPSYPKMKQIPMRKTPYSLRPDRAIPDLDTSPSPPPPTIEKPSNKKLEEVANTRQIIMQSHPNNLHNNGNRKRRSDLQDAPPAKQTTQNNNFEHEMYSNNANAYDGNNTDDSSKYGKVLKNVIIDLSSSLRKMQTEMMQDFFNKQNALLEREHRFQIQQDHMIMRAFQQQTQEIMHSVKELIDSIKSNNNEQTNKRSKVEKEAKISKKNYMQQKRRQQPEEIEENPIETNEIDRDVVDDDDNDGVEEDNAMEQEDIEDIYTDGEEQQEQMEEHDENEDQDEHNNNVIHAEHDDQEEIENNADDENEDVVEDNEHQQEDEDESTIN